MLNNLKDMVTEFGVFYWGFMLVLFLISLLVDRLVKKVFKSVKRDCIRFWKWQKRVDSPFYNLFSTQRNYSDFENSMSRMGLKVWFKALFKKWKEDPENDSRIERRQYAMASRELSRSKKKNKKIVNR